MAKNKGNDKDNQKFGTVPHKKASESHNADADRLKRDPNHVQKLIDRQ